MLKILLAALAGTVVYFLVGWLIFEGLLGNYMSENTTQIVGFKKSEEESSMLMLIISCAAYALLLAILLGSWTQGCSVWEGAKIGAITGILVAIMTDTYWFSTSHFYNSLTPLLLDVAAAGLSVGIMGAAIAWVLSVID
jgi:sterol desaturase/sphingolipid hydroxylase (fatty acid hydroxylase superfamily)